MKLKNNQNGIAHLAVIILVVFVSIIGFVGWKVWDRNESTSSTQDLSGTEPKVAAGPGIEIPSLGIKINDPENRGLSHETTEICSDECTNVEMIRDNNDDYFGECKYPASIRKITDSENPLEEMKPTDYYYNLTKKVGTNWYQARTGSNFQQNCKYNADGSNPYEEYEKGLRLYLANNIVEL